MSTQPKPSDSPPNFYAMLSSGSKSTFYLAIFCIFSVFGLLWEIGTPLVRPAYLVVVLVLVSGTIAVGYAYASTRNLKLLFLVIPASGIIPAMEYFARLPSTTTGSSIITAPVPTAVLATTSYVLIVVGYILFVSFINREGTRSLRMQTEIGLAKRIHTNLVPPVSISTPRWELRGLSIPSTEVGGDLLDCVASDSQLQICVADVSGHGVHAGLMMGMVKSAVRMRLLRSHDLVQMVTDLNSVIMQIKTPEMFVTAAFMHLDSTGLVQIALAGHPPILHYQHVTGRVVRHESPHPPLGVVPALSFIATQFKISAGDLLCILTDGITEIFDSADEEFGLDRVEMILSEMNTASLLEIEEAILSAGSDFGAIDDDRTLLLVRFRAN